MEKSNRKKVQILGSYLLDFEKSDMNDTSPRLT